MGMNNYGGYSRDDVELTRNAGNYSMKKAANIEELKKRLSEKGAAGTMYHIFFVKMKRIWGNSEFAGDDYIDRKPKEQSLLRDILGLNNDKHWILLIFSWIIHFALVWGMFLGFLFAYRRKIENEILFIRLSIIGISLFLLIWECNSRYLFSYSSLIIIFGIEGISHLRRTYRSWLGNKL